MILLTPGLLLLQSTNEQALQARARVAARNLTSEDKDIRISAWYELDELRGAAAEAVLEAAQSWDEQQQHSLLVRDAQALASYLADPRAIGPLTAALDDTNPKIRIFAAGALAGIGGEQLLETAVKAMHDVDPGVRRMAVHILVSVGNRRAYELITETAKDPSERVRRTVARMAWWLGGFEAVDTLIRMLNDPSESVVQAAAVSLGHIGDERAVGPLIQTLRNKCKDVIHTASVALGRIGISEAVDPLLKVLAEAEDGTTKYFASQALIEIGSVDAVEPLITALQHHDDVVRQLAARVLGKLGDLRAADPLANLLSDANTETGHSAALALASLGDTRATEFLVDMLSVEPTVSEPATKADTCSQVAKDTAVYFRMTAASTLGSLGDKRAIDPLLEVLDDESTELDVATALAKLGINKGAEHLIRLLQTSDENSLCAVIKAIGNAMVADAVQPLSSIIESESSPDIYRTCAIQALGQIATESAIDKLTEYTVSDAENALDAADALARMGQENGFVYLFSKLRNGSKPERSLIAQKLGYIGDTKAVEPLIAALSDQAIEVRIGAAKALGKIGDTCAVEPLTNALEDGSYRVRAVAARALRGIKARGHETEA